MTIAQHLPWLLSALTVYMTILAGNQHRMAWAWGLLPMNATLWVVYARNHLRWRSGRC